ncbi:MAG: hypothetical protein R2867_42520 [Caldilineaceae bacterium]
MTEYYLLLEKGKRTRIGEEEIVGHTILNAIADGFAINQRVAIALDDGDALTTTAVDYPYRDPSPW